MSLLEEDEHVSSRDADSSGSRGSPGSREHSASFGNSGKPYEDSGKQHSPRQTKVLLWIVVVLYVFALISPLLYGAFVHFGVFMGGGVGHLPERPYGVQWTCLSLKDYTYDGVEIMDANRMNRLEFSYGPRNMTTRTCLSNTYQVYLVSNETDWFSELFEVERKKRNVRRMEVMAASGGELVCEHTTPGYLITQDLEEEYEMWRFGKYHNIHGSGRKSEKEEEHALYEDPRVWQCRDKRTSAYSILDGRVVCEQIPWREGMIVAGSCALYGSMTARKDLRNEMEAMSGEWWPSVYDKSYRLSSDISCTYLEFGWFGQDCTGWDEASGFVNFDRGLTPKRTDEVRRRRFSLSGRTNTRYAQDSLFVQTGDLLLRELLLSQYEEIVCTLMDGYDGVYHSYVENIPGPRVASGDGFVDGWHSDFYINRTTGVDVAESVYAEFERRREELNSAAYFASTDAWFIDPRPWRCGNSTDRRSDVGFGNVMIGCERVVVDTDIISVYEDSCVMYL